MRGKPIDDKKTDVVPRMLVFDPGISETGNQTNLWNFFFHSRSDENQIRQDLSSAALTKIERIQTAYFFCSFSLGIEGPRPFHPLPFSRQSLRVQPQLRLQPQLVLLRLLGRAPRM